MITTNLSQRILTSMSRHPSGLRVRRALGSFKRGVVMPPVNELVKLRSWGVRGYFLAERWTREMEAAAYHLPPLSNISSTSSPLHVWYLTGAKYWYQTAFCAWSLAVQAKRQVHLHLVDDGTLTAEQIAVLAGVFEKVDVIDSEAARQNLIERLPPSKFPVLNQRWREYVHIRKLIDIHLGTTGKKLVLDSDMLFFDDPKEIIQWCDGDDARVLHMLDFVESYGYDRRALEELAGAPLPHLLNVGICGMDSGEIDWELLERWCADLIGRFGMSYYLEQALVAMMASTRNRLALGATEYITLPPRDSPRRKTPILHHYVAESKPIYFGWGWRHALDLGARRS